MYKSGRRSWWYRQSPGEVNLAPISTRRSPRGHYALCGLRHSQEDHQFLREAGGWNHSERRRGESYAQGSEPVDGDTSEAVDGGHGSDHLHQLGVRSPAAARGSGEGSAPADAAGDHRGQEEERSHRCWEDCRSAEGESAAGVLHGAAGASRSEAEVAIPQSAGAPEHADEEQSERAADGIRHRVQQTEAAPEAVFQRAAEAPGGRATAAFADASAGTEPDHNRDHSEDGTADRAGSRARPASGRAH